MFYDGTPAGPGMPHPLDSFAPASARDALSCVLASHSTGILEAWERHMRRVRTPALSPLPRHTFAEALMACRELLGSGSQHALEMLFDGAMAEGGTTLRATDEAARLNRMLSGLTVVAWPFLLERFAGEPERQSEAMALLLAVTHFAAMCLYAALERLMSTEVQAAQERQLRFFQEITRLATNNRLRLVDPHEIPAPEGSPLPIREARDGARMRRTAAGVAATTEMPQSRRDDLTLAVGEAVSNVLKHAGQGIGHVWRRDDTVYVFIADTGRGITLENLPKALTPGWSSEPSLGMGFTLMLEMVDTLWLSTGAFGTTVCVEKSIAPRTDPLLETLLHDDHC